MKLKSFQVYTIISIITGLVTGYVLQLLDFVFLMRLIYTISEIFEAIFLFVTPWIIIIYITSGIMSLKEKSEKLIWRSIWLSAVSSGIAGAISFSIASFILPALMRFQPKEAVTNSALTTLFNFITLPSVHMVTVIIGAILLGLGLSLSKRTLIHKFVEDLRIVIDASINRYYKPYMLVFIYGNMASVSYKLYDFILLYNFTLILILIVVLQFIFILLQYSFLYGYLGLSPYTLLKGMMPAYFVGFGSRSSSTSVPITYECMKKLGVRDCVADTVAPLCSIIHKVGDIIAIVVSTVGLMFVYGNVPEFHQILLFLFVITLVNVISPGVPGGGGLAALSVIDSMLGFVNFQKILLVSLFRAQDSFGTGSNILGDVFIATLINKSKLNELKKARKK